MGLFVLGAAVVTLPAHGLTLSEAQKLLAEDGAAADRFGIAVAVSGGTAVIGANEDDDNGAESGAAYVFVRDVTGAWVQQAKLLPSDGAAGERFGVSVAISGDTVVVGASLDDVNGTASGSAYVFTRSGSVWSQQAKLVAGDGAAGDNFGYSVAADAETALIGAWRDDSPGGDAGSAYVFVRSGGSWSFQAKLLAADGAVSDEFGSAVALSGDTAVVGAVYADAGAVSNAGAAYVFVRSGGSWSPQAKLTASDPGASDQFGCAAALSDDTAVIGARWDDDLGSNSGSAYVFVRSGSAWSQQAKLLGSGVDGSDEFGYSVAISADRAVVGAPGDADAGSNSGTAYVFTRPGTGMWVEGLELEPSDKAAYDRLATSVAISDASVVLGAPVYFGITSLPGSAYAFVLPDSSSVEEDLAALIAEVEALVELGKVPRGLLAHLLVVEKSLADQEPWDAIDQLGAFIKHVEGIVRSRRLTSAEAEGLISAAEDLIEAIGQSL